MSLFEFREGFSILIADDDHTDRMLVRHRLQKLGANDQIKIVEVENGQEAFEALRNNRFDCALIDFRMPIMSGAEVVAAMTSSLTIQRSPVIILSGLNDEAFVSYALRSGAEDYLIKGEYSAKDLARAVRYAIERFRVRDELAKANALLEREAVTDPLTGVLNRRGFQRALSIEQDRMGRTGGHLFGILVDLDDFKQVNKKFGHAGGDVVLRELARRIKRTLRSYDQVARIGGDEFMLMVSNTENDGAMLIAERARLEIADLPVLFGEEAIMATASLSVFHVPPVILDVTGLLTLAQMGLEVSKTSGKNRVTLSELARR